VTLTPTPTPGQTVVEAWLAGQTDLPWVLVDQIELDRFHHTYYAIPEAPALNSASRVVILGPSGR